LIFLPSFSSAINFSNEFIGIFHSMDQALAFSEPILK